MSQPPDLILRSLQKILASVPFARSPRLARFLRYLVERAIANADDDLHEYAVGVGVFDRAPDYDQRLDPIVRVEARRLRAKLRLYYEREGCFDPIRIEIPARGYVPVFLDGNPIVFDGLPDLSQPSSTTSLAVLPLVSRSADPGQEFFADGLTDEITCLAGDIDCIQVVARTSAFQFKGKAMDVRAMGAQLDADHVIEGSVRREGDDVRVSVQLVNAAQGFRVWSNTYDQKVSSVLEAQRRIAQAIVEDVRSSLASGIVAASHETAVTAYSAYAMYLRGRSHLNNRTEDGIKRSVGCFQHVIEKDPRYALAYAGLADAFSLGARYEIFPPQESWTRARAAALSALRIDDSLAEAHTSLAFVDLHYRWDWWSAERSFCKALSLNPNYVPARQWYAWYLAVTGKHEMAIRNLQQAQELDPLSPNVSADLALAFYFSRRYDDVMEQCLRTVDLAPGFYRPHHLRGLTYLQKGQYLEAIEQFQLAIELSHGNPKMFVLLAHACACMGKKDEAEKLLSEVAEKRNANLAGIDFALLYSTIGDRERMFVSLERAYAEHDSELIWLAIDPIYERVRSDPRIKPMLQGIGKPEAPAIVTL